jgi:transposase
VVEPEVRSCADVVIGHCGRVFTQGEVDAIIDLAGRSTTLSRTGLAARVCEQLQWQRASGALKTRECLDLLGKLEQRGALELPAPRAGRPRGSHTQIPYTGHGEWQAALVGALGDVSPVELELVKGAQAHALWRELVGRYHYLGYAPAFGAQLRYLVHVARPQAAVVGCVQFSSAAWRIAVRDQWIGWDEQRRRENLSAVVQQSRFLLLPWVRVRYLASHVLALSCRHVVRDWSARYGRQPLLVETLVDGERFAATSYRAANWIDVGLSAGCGRTDTGGERHPKRVFVYPLRSQAAQQLAAGSEPRPVRTPRAPSARGVVRLSEEVRRELERRVLASTAEQRAVRRARIILALADGLKTNEAARVAHTSTRTVELWRARFVRESLAGLEDRPGRGRKRAYDNLTRMEIVAVACDPLRVEEPGPCRCHQRTAGQQRMAEAIENVVHHKKLGPGLRAMVVLWVYVDALLTMIHCPPQEQPAPPVIVRRTIAQVRDEVVRRGVASAISKSTVQRILSEGDLHPHTHRGWLHSPDPHFRQKATAICELYHHRPEGSVVISVDEKTGMQACERCHPDRAVGAEVRREYEYERHGTQALLAGLNVHTGEVIGHCKDHRSANDLIELMEALAQRYPTGIVHVIWDNLNTHYDGVEKRWSTFNARHGNRFVFHYTPKHASWVNQIELFFSILQRRYLRHASFRSTFELHTGVLEFIAQWNGQARPFRWTFRGYPLQAGVALTEAA